MRGPVGHRTAPGFTLVELLVVLAVLSLLMVALLPQIGKALRRQEEVVTRARLERLESLIREFERSMGFYPPDDFSDPRNVLRLPADSTNPGIESLLIHLHREDYRGQGLEDEITQGWTGNTDGDKAPTVLGRLGTTEKLEVLDGWGNPIAYFQNRGYGRTQLYQRGDGEVMEVRAWRREGGYVNPRSYQLFSAGPNGIYGDADDIARFTLPAGEKD